MPKGAQRRMGKVGCDLRPGVIVELDSIVQFTSVPLGSMRTKLVGEGETHFV